MNSRAHALVREGEKGEACLLTLLLLELNIRTPGRGITRGRGFMRSRGGLRCAAGKENGWLLFTHLKPKAEGYETEILTKLHLNHKNRMRKPQTYNLLICAGHNERWIAYTAWRYSPLLHRNHEVGEVSGRRVSKAGRKKAVSRIWKSPDADDRKTAASSAHFGIYTAKTPLVEFRRARVAGLIVQSMRELLSGARKHVHELRIGRWRPRLLTAKR